MTRRRAETLRLDNGATLIVVPEPNAPAVALVAAVRAGLREDGPAAGTSALLARMLGGDAEGRTAALLQLDIDTFGGFGVEYDGELIGLWAVSDPDPAETARAAQTLLLGALTRPRFTDTLLAVARADLKREQALRPLNPTLTLLDRLKGRALGTDAGPLGSPDTVARVGVEQIEAFHRRWFRPERTVLVAVGRTTPDAARELCRSLLNVGGWDELGKARPTPPPPPPEPIPAGLRDIVLPRVDRTSAAGIGFLAPGTDAGSERWATLAVLDAVAGLGKGSRLFALRDREGLGYEVRSTVLSGRSGSVWAAYLLGDRPATELRDALLRVADGLARGAPPVTAAELARAKALLKGQRAQAQQTLVRRARAVAWAESVGLPGFETDFDRRIDAVTPEAVGALARQIFSAHPAVVRR